MPHPIWAGVLGITLIIEEWLSLSFIVGILVPASMDSAVWLGFIVVLSSVVTLFRSCGFTANIIKSELEIAWLLSAKVSIL